MADFGSAHFDPALHAELMPRVRKPLLVTQINDWPAI